MIHERNTLRPMIKCIAPGITTGPFRHTNITYIHFVACKLGIRNCSPRVSLSQGRTTPDLDVFHASSHPNRYIYLLVAICFSIVCIYNPPPILYICPHGLSRTLQRILSANLTCDVQFNL